MEKNKPKLEAKIHTVLSQIDTHIELDSRESSPDELPTISSDELVEKVKELNARLSQMNKSQQKQIKKLADDYLPRLQKYEDQLQILGTRNSYSKTDESATFMRMKEAYMKNGQLKSAYNIQISTQNQFITNLGIFQYTGDTSTLVPMLEDFQNRYHKQSRKFVADSGYGSEQNYEFMENTGIEAFVKYNYFHKEQKRAFRKDAFHPSNLYYNKEQNHYICPMGQRMNYTDTRKHVSELGYVATLKRYKQSIARDAH